MSRFLIILIVVLSVHSCKEEGIAGDIIETKKHAKESLEELQNLKLAEFPVEQAEKYIEELGPYFSSLDKKSLRVFVELSNTEKGRKKMTVNPPVELEKEFVFSIKQLSALYTAFKKDSLNIDSVQVYLTTEKQVLGKLNQDILTIKNNRKMLLKGYDRLIPRAKYLIDSINDSK